MNWNEDIKLSLLSDGIVLYIGNPMTLPETY